LFEVVLALAILALLSGAVFAITSAALEATKATRSEQQAAQRLEGFLRVTRDAFLGLDAKGSVVLRPGPAGETSRAELVFERTTGAFGIPSLAGGSLVLSALPQSDGSRSFALRRLPKDDGRPPDDKIPWTPLFPGVGRVQWSFFSNQQWSDEWKSGQGRPELVRLTFECRDLGGEPVETVFWIPPLAGSPSTEPPPPKGTPPP
jgi:hypothetical protein